MMTKKKELTPTKIEPTSRRGKRRDQEKSHNFNQKKEKQMAKRTVSCNEIHRQIRCHMHSLQNTIRMQRAVPLPHRL